MQNSADFSAQLERIRQGDRGALEALLTAWRPILRAQARGMLGSRFAARADSSDMVQETMVHAFQDITAFRGCSERQWAAWLNAILRNVISKARRHHLAEGRALGREAGLAAEVAAADSARGESRLIERETLAALAAEVERLPAPMQEVLFRRFFLKQPFADIGPAMDRSAGAARVLWWRAIRRLQQQCHDSEACPPKE